MNRIDTSTNSASSNDRIRGLLFGFAAATIWGGFPILTKMPQVDNSLDASAITQLRFLVAGVLLFPIFLQIWPMLFNRIRKEKHFLLLILVVSASAGFPYIWIAGTALKESPASHFSIYVPTMTMLVSTLLSKYLFKEHVSRSVIIAIAIVFSGLLLASSEGLNQPTLLFSDGLLLIAGVLWALFTVFSKQLNLKPLQIISIISVISMFTFSPGLFWNSSILHSNWNDIILQAVFQGLLSAIIALILYTRAINLLGVSRASLFGALVPVATIIFSFAIFETWPSLYEISGSLLVAMGIVFSVLSTKKWVTSE